MQNPADLQNAVPGLWNVALGFFGEMKLSDKKRPESSELKTNYPSMLFNRSKKASLFFFEISAIDPSAI